MSSYSYETRIITKDEALAFIQNMRWFANRGNIRIKSIDHERCSVTASKYAWSMWVSV